MLGAVGSLLVLAAGGAAAVRWSRGEDEPESAPTVGSVAARPSTVSTLAGNGDVGVADGPADVARFEGPVRITVDRSGVLYVTDGNRIRRVSAAGEVRTLAGDLEEGFVDGPAPRARFNAPGGIAVDGAGMIYIADRENHRIRTLSPDGVVRTLAGSGSAGMADGPGDRAQFNSPADVAVDGDGNVYVADSLNNRIRRIEKNGTVSTFAGGEDGMADGPRAEARFSFPNGLAGGTDGTLFVADSYNGRVRAIGRDGTVRTLAGSGESGGADGPAETAQFADPSTVAVGSAGIVYVLDKTHRLRQIATNGEVTTAAGKDGHGFADGAGATAQFNAPQGVAVAPDGAVYVADTENRRIRVVRFAG